MKRISASVYLLLALAGGLLCLAANAQEKTVKKVPARATVAVDGKSLFNQYCAVCHGQDAKGGGPAAEAMKNNPTDLTQISRQNGGKFPDQKILADLKGDSPNKAHGSADMPIWGPIFSNMNASLNQGQTRMYSLLSYLESIQAK